MLLRSISKAMAPHSSTLAWKIPWTEEPGGLQSMVSLRVGHNWATSLSLFTCMHWKRKWQPTPVFLPRESQGRGSLVGCPLWGRAESDMTEAPLQQQQQSTNSHSRNKIMNSQIKINSPCMRLPVPEWAKADIIWLWGLRASRTYSWILHKLPAKGKCCWMPY